MAIVFSILGSWLMRGFYFQTWACQAWGDVRERSPVWCRCRFVGPARALTIHWKSFHDVEVLLCLCPLPGCIFQTPKPQGLRQHWEGCHNTTRYQSSQLRTLPLLANSVQNRHRIDHGSVCPPVPPVQWPLDSLPHCSKDALLVQVKGILQMPKQEVASTPATSSLLEKPHPRCARGVHRRPRVAVQESQVTSDDRRPSAATMDMPGIILPTPVTMTSSSPKDSPILVQSSPSYEQSLSESPVSPTFMTLSTLTLPFLVSSSPTLPPVTTPSSDRDPVLAPASPQLLELVTWWWGPRWMSLFRPVHKLTTRRNYTSPTCYYANRWYFHSSPLEKPFAVHLPPPPPPPPLLTHFS